MERKEGVLTTRFRPSFVITHTVAARDHNSSTLVRAHVLHMIACRCMNSAASCHARCMLAAWRQHAAACSRMHSAACCHAHCMLDAWWPQAAVRELYAKCRMPQCMLDAWRSQAAVRELHAKCRMPQCMRHTGYMAIACRCIQIHAEGCLLSCTCHAWCLAIACSRMQNTCMDPRMYAQKCARRGPHAHSMRAIMHAPRTPCNHAPFCSHAALSCGDSLSSIGARLVVACCCAMAAAAAVAAAARPLLLAW
eukprot:6927-Chlamydomonas_euryale.AAC.3